MAAIPVPPVHRIALIQLAVALVSGLLFFLVDDVFALSVLVGAVIQIVPQAFFTRAVFKYSGASQAAAVLQQFYRGESGKLMLTAVMFAVAFIYLESLNYLLVFLSFFTMIVVHGICAVKLLNQA